MSSLVKRNQTHNFWGKNSSWPKSVTSRISAFFQTATVFLGFPEPLRFLFGGGHGIWRSRFQSFPQSFFSGPERSISTCMKQGEQVDIQDVIKGICFLVERLKICPNQSKATRKKLFFIPWL